jgi:hypothetical protein
LKCFACCINGFADVGYCHFGACAYGFAGCRVFESGQLAIEGS